MGNSTFDPSAWSAYSSTVTGKTARSTFTNTTGTKKAYNPINITVRESKDSPANPNSTPIIIALDQTGSMSNVIQAALEGCGTLFKEIYDRKPVSDPHVMFMFVGDVNSDRYPLQATQFEADIILADQMRELHIEGNGGGNNSESYHLPFYFAATRTDCDAFAKGRKGYIFVIGDEDVPPPLSPAQIKQVFGPDESVPESLSYETLLQMVQENWEVFHIRVMQGHARGGDEAGWKRVLNERAIPLDDITKLSEVIVATLEVLGGKDADTVASSFSGSTALTVRRAVTDLAAANNVAKGVVAL